MPLPVKYTLDCTGPCYVNYCNIDNDVTIIQRERGHRRDDYDCQLKSCKSSVHGCICDRPDKYHWTGDYRCHFDVALTGTFRGMKKRSLDNNGDNDSKPLEID